MDIGTSYKLDILIFVCLFLTQNNEENHINGENSALQCYLSS